MLDRRFGIATLTCCFLIGSPVAIVVADEVLEEDTLEEGGKKCIDTRRIRRTDIIDNQNILFYMRGGEIYRNHLPNRCPSLRRGTTFSYRSTISRLCDIDIITILYNQGSGLSRGASCGLGKFLPITEDEVQALKGDPEIEQEPVPPAEPEEIE